MGTFQDSTQSYRISDFRSSSHSQRFTGRGHGSAFVPQKFDITGLHNAIGITYRPPSAWCPFETLPETPPGSLHSSLSRTVAQPSCLSLSSLLTAAATDSRSLIHTSTPHTRRSAPLDSSSGTALTAQNPWYMGGNIGSGLPGGSEIVQSLLAKAWNSADDGETKTCRDLPPP